jgi:hypothetical protein
MVVGVVHLAPLPGAPRFAGDMGAVLSRARSDARGLEEAGVDAVLVENFGDAPFFPDRVPPATVASMAVVCAELRRAAQVPIGINVLRNDAAAALSIAASAGLAFARVNVHAGARLTDQGIVEGRAHETLRLRRALGIEGVLILADVQVKHSAGLAARSLTDEARELAGRALADVLLVTGSATSAAPSAAEVAEVRRSVEIPVLVASGVDLERGAELLAHADGCIVGSAFKRDGRAENEVDPDRARKIVAALKRQDPRGGGR